jgi:hypothetical protein
VQVHPVPPELHGWAVKREDVFVAKRFIPHISRVVDTLKELIS